MSRRSRIAGLLLIALVALCQGAPALAQSRSSEWEKVLEAAKKEGRVAVSIPTSAELRKEFETGFKKAFPGIELDLNVARGSSNINKIAEEQNAGVQTIDVHMGGTTSIITGLLTANFLDPVPPSLAVAGKQRSQILVGRALLGRQCEAMARGQSAISIGVSYHTYQPFIKAGLPVRSISNIKEGYYAESGSGNLALLKNQPHPNAAKVFANWLLSKEAQTAVTKALGQPTRRFDVDTKWTREVGHPAAKEVLTPEKFDELENGSEDVVAKFRKPAMQLAEGMFK